jgi:drug/metabolite transporter (DMT)-like permease
VTPLALALVVGAALLHASWNALAKRGGDQLVFLWSSVTLGTLLLGPWALRVLAEHGLPAEAVPFVLATILIHAVYFWALGRSYRDGDFSRVYPIARGLGVALVPILAVPLLGERPSGFGAGGIALVVLGIVLLQRARDVRAAPRPGGHGTGWALLTGLTIAAYSLVDRAGVARLHPVPYIALLGAGSVLILLPAVVARGDALRHEWVQNWRTILLASSMNLTAYLLVLFAFRLSKVGYVVAARELSIVFSTLIGGLWLGEGHFGPRVTAATLVLAGVLLVAVAR